MEKKQQERYQQALVDMRKRLIESVTAVENALRENILPPGEHAASRMHPGDQDVEGLDEQLALAQNEEQLLEQVEAALLRIEAGCFGKCEDCGRAIGAERLAAVPYASWCIECARANE